MNTGIRGAAPAAAVAAVALIACAGSAASGASLGYNPEAKAEYRRIFTQVLQQFIAAKPGPNVCLPPLFGFGELAQETVEIVPDADPQGAAMAGMATSRAAQFKALEAAGLVSSTESSRAVGGQTQRVLTYRRTAKGLAVAQGPSLCYARGELDQIVKWKGPVVLGAYQAAFVYYTVKTTRIDDWARSADIQAAFPTIRPIVKGEPAKVRQVVIDLSSEGWEVADYSKYLQMQ